MSWSIHTWQWQWWKKIGLLWGCGRYRCVSKGNAIFLAALPIVSWTSRVGTHNHRWQMTTSKSGFNQTWLFDPAIYFNESWLKKRKSISLVLDVSKKQSSWCSWVHFGWFVLFCVCSKEFLFSEQLFHGLGQSKFKIHNAWSVCNTQRHHKTNLLCLQGHQVMTIIWKH